MNKPILYMMDGKGQPREVKVIRDQPIFAVDPSVELPKFNMGGVEFSVDVEPGAFKQMEKILKEHDREILKAYDTFAKALECCLQDVRRCRECPLKEDDSCRGRLLHNVLKALLNHKELHRQMMLDNLMKERKNE